MEGIKMLRKIDRVAAERLAREESRKFKALAKSYRRELVNLTTEIARGLLPSE